MKSKVDFFREVDVGNLRASTGGWFRVPRLWMDQDMGQRILVLTVCNICFSTNASFTVPSIPSSCTSSSTVCPRSSNPFYIVSYYIR